MNLERYQLETDDNSEIFEFISIGSKGRILKRIKYTQTEDPKVIESFNGRCEQRN